jgi:site-specific DNA-methyltransferase (adenine-specific)
MSVERFLDPNQFSPDELEILRDELAIWKTPQVKSCIEPIVFAQKPKIGPNGESLTFLANWILHRVGLVNLQTKVGNGQDMTTANVMTSGPINDALDRAFLVSKPKKSEKGETTHISVKPLALMDQLINATVPKGGVVLDPFSGSGTTGLSALQLGRNFVGFELSKVYFEQSLCRFSEMFAGMGLEWTAQGQASQFASLPFPVVSDARP